MRIVLITPEYPPAERMGGIGTNAATIAPALARRGHDVHVVTRGPADEYVEQGVRVVRLDPRWVPEPRIERLVARRQTAREVRRLRPDVAQAPEWEAAAWWLTRWTDVPVVTRLATPTYLLDELNVGQHRASTSFVRRLERDQTRRSAAVLAPTRSIAARVGADWDLAEERIRVIPNPVDLDSVEALGAGEPPPDVPGEAIVFIGRLERRKGIEVLGDALPAVLAAYPDLHAVLIGRDAGEDGGAVMERFRRSVAPVHDRVHVVGELPRDRALPIVASAALVVLPSLWENFANACLEAMALARPVVATRTGGFVEFLEEGQSGWLVPPGDSAALARVLELRLGDRDALRRVGEGAARRAADFAVDPIAERVESLYEDVLERRNGGTLGTGIYVRDYRRYFRPDDRRDPFHRLYAAKRSAVLRTLGAEKTSRLLDVGGGYGRIGGPLSERHRVTLCDISPHMLEEAARAWPRLELVEADARALPFEDGAYDIALALDLLPHLPDLESALLELARVVRPGGRLVFDTTNASPWWVPAYPAYVNWRPKRLLLTMRAGGVLPEWRPLVRHHKPADVRDAIARVGLSLESVQLFGPRWSPKWHLWWTRKS